MLKINYPCKKCGCSNIEYVIPCNSYIIGLFCCKCGDGITGVQRGDSNQQQIMLLEAWNENNEPELELIKIPKDLEKLFPDGSWVFFPSGEPVPRKI